MAEIIIYAGSLSTLALFLVGLYIVFKGRDHGYARIADFKAESSAATTSTSLLTKSNPKIDKSLKVFRRMLLNEKSDVRVKRKNQLAIAGFYGKDAPLYYYAARMILAFIFCIVAAFVLFNQGKIPSPLVLTLIMVGAALFGSTLPYLFVYSKAKDRQNSFTRGLPDAMDMLLICIESGLSFPAALKFVSRDIEQSHPIVAEQLNIATLEFQAGRRRSEALQNLATRVDTPQIHSLVMMIIQSENLGTSLTRALRAAANDLRKDRMLKAEEKAQALPAKMSVPLVLCIFPTLFTIILLPVIIRIITELPG